MIKRENIEMKLTPQRLAILDCLDGNTRHPSAADVFRAIAPNFPTMSIATVYNTLETLKEKGVVKELGIDSDKKRFDPNTEPHHHLICLNCKEIIDVFSDFSLDLQENEKYGYEIVGKHVDFYGICPKCKEKSLIQIQHK
jgi:Fur family transcriptional regulator, peroxide stress response regulator